MWILLFLEQNWNNYNMCRLFAWGHVAKLNLTYIIVIIFIWDVNSYTLMSSFLFCVLYVFFFKNIYEATLKVSTF